MDCRRTLQLDYFGENFSKEECLKIPDTSCDNCSRKTKFKEIDATSYCRNIVSAVNELCTDKFFTILQMVEVFKGAETKKIVDFGLNRSKYHGQMKSWERSDLQRLFHTLMSRKYLKEEVKIFRDIPQNYVKVGPNCAELMNSGSAVKIMFAMTEKNQPVQKAKKIEVTAAEKEAEALRDQCYHDLLDVVIQYASDRNMVSHQVISMQALIEMAKRMPTSEADMKSIPQVTNANYDKVGKELLKITQNYAAKRDLSAIGDMLDDDMDDDEMESSQDQSQSQDWNSIARKASASSASGSFKRKSASGGWGGSQTKRFKRATGRKRKTPTKKKKSPAKKKRSPAKKAPVKKSGLMPLPKPKF